MTSLTNNEQIQIIIQIHDFLHSNYQLYIKYISPKNNNNNKYIYLYIYHIRHPMQ